MTSRRSVARGAGRRHGDDGFSLPEVLISVVVMAVIMTVLAGVISVVVRNLPSSEARAEDARSVMGLVTWLPQDVDSTPPDGFDVDPETASGCGTDDPDSVNLLRLEWSERIGTSTETFVADYRHVTDGDEATVTRTTCSGTGTGPFPVGDVQNVTSDLPPLPTSWAPGLAPAAVTFDVDDTTGDVTLVTVELTTLAGDVVKVDSAPKNPANTLPTTTLPDWYPPTPSTSPATNSLPTTSNASITAHPDTVTSIDLVVDDSDGDTLAVELVSSTVPVDWAVSLLGLTLSVRPDTADVGTTSVIEYTVDDQQGDGVVTGSVTVEVVETSTSTTVQPTTTTSTTTTTIPPPCEILSATLDPSVVDNVQSDSHNQGRGNVNVGVLAVSVAVNAVTNDRCDGLYVRYDSRGVNSPPFVNLIQVGPTSWRVSLPGADEGSSETWKDGPRPLEFFDSSGGPYASVTLTVE